MKENFCKILIFKSKLNLNKIKLIYNLDQNDALYLLLILFFYINMKACKKKLFSCLEKGLLKFLIYILKCLNYSLTIKFINFYFTRKKVFNISLIIRFYLKTN